MVVCQLACNVVLQVEEVAVCALHDGHQGLHGGNFLNLFLQEPEDELLAQCVVLSACCGEQGLDLTGDNLLLCQGHVNDFLNVLEVVLDSGNSGNLDLVAAVQLVLNHHECVLALLEGLAVEELSQLGQVFAVEPDSHGQVLVRCCELVADLLVQKVVERLRHMVSPYMVIAS